MLQLRRWLPLLPFLFLAFAACAGEVSTATGGSGGTGGSSGGTGGTGGGAGGTTGCPVSPPSIGQPCSVAEQTCSYSAGCCPLAFQCEGSTWQQLWTGCPVPPVSCPVDPPAAGQACNDCFEPGPCTYGCPGTPASVTANCTAGVWAIDGACPVPPPVECGGTMCKVGEICVETAGGPGFFYTCAADPCAPGPLSCACAKDLCGGPPYVCGGAMGQTLECSCPMCP